MKEIIEKHKGFPRMISDQKFNLHVKDVCEEAGFKQKVEGAKMNSETKRKEKGEFPFHELVSSHICRRSFATNLYGKLDNLTIMAITGHQTETQFLKYIKVTKKEKAEKLKAYWQKQAEENNFEEKVLTVVK